MTEPTFFSPLAGLRSPAHARVHAAYEVALTIASVAAALLFIVGSIMFFSEAWLIPGTWCFLIGSVLFAIAPSLKLVREVHFWRMGEVERLARKVEDPSE